MPKADESKVLMLAAPVDGWIEAADTGTPGDKPVLRRFAMTAYTGGPMALTGFAHPVVVDLAGLKVSAKSRPILKDHNRSLIVGHTDSVSVQGSSLQVKGVISGAGPVAREIVESSRNGFPWQASLGAVAEQMEFVPKGKRAHANGREFEGPITIARRSALGEVSFVALGADDNTAALVATLRTDCVGTGSKESSMNFEQWVESKGFTAADLTDSQRATLQAAFDAERKNSDGESGGTASSTGDGEGDNPPYSAAVLAQIRAEASAETKRITDIRRICSVSGGRHAQIEAKAIAEGWDATRTELEVLRAERPIFWAPAVGRGREPLNARVLEAAACLASQLKEDTLVKEYGERVMEAAHAMRHIGLRELVAHCARLEGMDVPAVFGDGVATIRAGFSTVSLPGIMENVMNKTMLDAYQAQDVVAFDLCRVGSVSDFKEVARYRFLGTGGFEKVASDGELKTGKVDEQKYTNQADTYGQTLMLTRKDIINDDLNAFMDIPRQMGVSGAQIIDELFFTLLLANPGNFFAAGNNNYLTGVDSAFGPDALTNAKTLFRKQKAGPTARVGGVARDAKPLNIKPEILLVPVELETDAEILMGSAQIMLDGSTSKTKLPTDNPHRNKYRVVSAPHLSDTLFTGNSGKAWYLFADPAVLAAFELVFLQGRREPVIERIDAAPNVLGMGFRGYIDVGVKEQDPRAAVKVKGEA
jgi:hypothetical protein